MYLRLQNVSLAKQEKSCRTSVALQHVQLPTMRSLVIFVTPARLAAPAVLHHPVQDVIQEVALGQKETCVPIPVELDGRLKMQILACSAIQNAQPAAMETAQTASLVQ